MFEVTRRRRTIVQILRLIGVILELETEFGRSS